MSPTDLQALSAKCHELGDALAAHAANPHVAAAVPSWLATVTQILTIVVTILNGLKTPAPTPTDPPAA